MSFYLGIDTSNYTTSVALYDSENDKIYFEKKLLSVKEHEKGLRQSDAVFSHIKALPELTDKLFKKANCKELRAVCVSVRPRNYKDSYMPCFLVGKTVAECISSVMGCKLYETSHQEGHIVSALYSVNQLALLKNEFYAFHISGGTTECLLVKPCDNENLNIEIAAKTLDINAGQLVDRIGVMLDIEFPCGQELDELSKKSNKTFKIKPCFKGLDVNMSGAENKAKQMLEKGEAKEDIAKYGVTYVEKVIEEMTLKVKEQYGEKPVLYAGGVMRNSFVRENLSKNKNTYFALPDFSSDNAQGVAVIGYLKDKYYGNINGITNK